MIPGTISFVAGVILLQNSVSLPNSGWLFISPLFMLFYWRFPCLRLPVVFCFGFLWALLYAHLLLDRSLPTALEGKDLVIEGVISSLPERQAQRLRFVFKIEQLNHQGSKYASPGLVRLSWYDGFTQVRVGERWRLTVRLKQPHGFMNPGGFDYEGWLFRQRIRATGYVRQKGDNRRLGEAGLAYTVDRQRSMLRDLFAEKVAEQRAAAIMSALVIGDRSGISHEDWELFRRTGTTHLIAISGLHIGIVAGFAFFLGRYAWSRSETLTLRLPAPIAGAFFALAGALIYAALAGFALPTQRALVMVGVFMAAVIFRQPLRSWQTLALALLLVVVLDPFAVLSPGLWLSFLAVAVILYGMTGRIRIPTWVTLWKVQLFVAIGLAPVLLAWNLNLSLLAPVINLMAVPLFSLVIVPLCLVGTLLLLLSELIGTPVITLAGWLLGFCGDALEWLSHWSAEYQLNGDLASWIWPFIALGILLLLAPWGFPGRFIGGIFLLPLVVTHNIEPKSGELWFTLLDVGQGQSAVLQTRNHILIYDTGPSFSSGFDAGSSVIVPYLDNLGIEQIDCVILSNGDMDHQGGYLSLVQSFPVKELLSGDPERILGHAAGRCVSGKAWQWDGVRFSILHPDQSLKWQGNNASCVLLVEAAGKRLLITGDIEYRAERWLLEQQGEALQADIVTVPHHGSRSSSRDPFVAAVAPSYALVSAGYRNRYGFPKQEVVQRWREAGASILNTANTGAIRLKLKPDAALSVPTLYRQQARHYWNHYANSGS